MSHILHQFVGVVVALVLCLAVSAGGVEAQEEKDSTSAVDSAESPKPTEDPAVGIEAWLKSIIDRLNTGEATISFNVEERAENVYVVSITSAGKTAERHGLLRLHWNQKQVANLTVVAGQDHCYVATVDGFSELKAPWGRWRLAEEGIPRVYSGIIPRVGTTIPRTKCIGPNV